MMKRAVSLLLAFACLTVTVHAREPESRTDFLKLIDRPKVALASQATEILLNNGLEETRFSFLSEAGQRVPGILFEPAKARGHLPVVIVMHGTAGRKEDEAGLLRRLAKRGFVAVAIDGRYHGERGDARGGAAAYQDAIVRTWEGKGGHPFYYDTVWDIMRLVDYLKTRPDVDDRRIGLTGISKGGIETYLATAADKRIAVAVPIIGVQSFWWALTNNAWQGRIATIQTAFDTVTHEAGVVAPDPAFVQKFYDRVVPGIYSEFDGPKMLTLIAPRPLLMINSDHDRNTPLPGVEECISVATDFYHDRHAADHFSAIIQPESGHMVKPESEQAMIDWFVRWLKP